MKTCILREATSRPGIGAATADASKGYCRCNSTMTS